MSRCVAVGVVALVVALAGCSGGGEDQLPTSTTVAPGTSGGTDRLDGLAGTAPLADVPASLADRLRRLAPTIGDDAPAAMRPYDAVIVAALAAEVARSDAPARLAADLLGVTAEGEECTTYATCRELTDALGDLDYDGPSGAIDLMADGQSGDATFGVYRFDQRGALGQVATESAEVPPPDVRRVIPDPGSGPRADGILQIAMIFPTAGPTAPLAEAARAGVRVAVDEVNSFEGVLGRPVELIGGDSGDGSAAATAAAVEAAVAAGADVVVGGVDAADTAALVEPVTAAGLVLIAPGASGTITTPGASSGLFFRLRPPVAVQGTVLAAAVADDGVTRATVVFADDPDGRAMAESFRIGFANLDGLIVADVAFAPGDAPAGVVDRATVAPTEAYVVIADDVAIGSVLAEMRRRDLDPSEVPVYVPDISTTLLATSA